MSDKAQIDFRETGNNTVQISLSGDFRLDDGVRDFGQHAARLTGSVKHVSVSDSGISDWDSSLLVFLANLLKYCNLREIECDLSQLPQGIQKMIALATAVPERKGAARHIEKKSFAERVGEHTVGIFTETLKSIEFIGAATVSFGRLLTGRAQYRKSDLLLIVQQCGPEALGIVTTICVLVGAILAFVGAIQLKMFGAEVYVANLVGIGMVMEMAALMTGIILSGRTGAAFAAQIGTMQVNEEIDALETLGISPMDYLVLPRMIALIIMTPLLVIYADILGILGGAVVGIFLLGIAPGVYFHQTFEMMTAWQCVQGLIKGSTFGMIVAVSGCMRGIQCGRSASAVGDAATSAVVTSIVAMVVADAILTLIFMLAG